MMCIVVTKIRSKVGVVYCFDNYRLWNKISIPPFHHTSTQWRTKYIILLMLVKMLAALLSDNAYRYTSIGIPILCFINTVQLQRRLYRIIRLLMCIHIYYTCACNILQFKLPVKSKN